MKGANVNFHTQNVLGTFLKMRTRKRLNLAKAFKFCDRMFSQHLFWGKSTIFGRW